jgi:stage II sporulation protein R
MKKIILVVLILIFFLSKNTVDGQVIIPNESIRMRVLANSNSVYDQQVKMKVSNNLQYEMYTLLKDTTDISLARTLIRDSMNSIDNNVKQTLKEENYPLGYTLDYGFHDFPEKEYKGVTYKAGNYESVLVTLGKGEGNNWWCVLFPPLCLLEAEEGKKMK